MRFLRGIVVVLALSIAPAAWAQAPFGLETVAEGLDHPVFVTAPAGDPRLFIVEQPGRIRIMVDGAVGDTPFLDIAELISSGGERGLLGLAFHPDYASNGRFFVNFTDPKGDTRVAEYKVSADPDAADPAIVKELLFVDQPRGNHNGGWIAFGPDGLLYVAMGDGGGAGDPRNNAQNPRTLLGKMVRLDVDGGEPEIFLSGVRNPWRNAWDGDDLYIADVGQSEWEEVNIVGIDDAGGNLGWRVLEGEACFTEMNCDTAGLTMPVHMYSHADGGCSITGGYVYRGAAIPALDGLYFFADYCDGILWSLRRDGDGVSDIQSYADTFGSLGQVTSFGVDSAGEMYLMTQDGLLQKFVPAS
jgi:glucose/arabinose dehydrogenase